MKFLEEAKDKILMIKGKKMNRHLNNYYNLKIIKIKIHFLYNKIQLINYLN